MQKMEKIDYIKPNKIGLLLRLVVKDHNDKTISDTEHKPTRSFVIQFLEFFYGCFRGTDYLATTTDNIEKYIYKGSWVLSQDNFYADAPLGNDNYGIVVGTNDGASPESNTDYKLDTKIAQGGGALQMMHGTTTIVAVAVVGANVDMEIKRPFTNLSGATITVKEVGIRTGTRHNGGMFYHLNIRDVVTDVPVPDNCSLTVYYTIRTTV